MNAFIDYTVTILLGTFVGIAELFARYRDEPFDAIKSPAGCLYLLINGFVSPLVLLVIRVFGWNFGIATGDDSGKVRMVQILVAGFSAMALLRSSLFNIRVANQEIGIGFSAVVQSILRAVDYSVDRKRGISRDQIVEIMDTISFEKAAALLPAYCLSLMQNLSSVDQESLAREVDNIHKLKADNAVKSRMLGLAIINVMGTRLLLAAVQSLGDKIKI